MKAVVFCGKYEVAVEDVPVPRIQSTQDAIVKVAFSAICGRSAPTCLLRDQSPCSFRLTL